MNYSQPFFSVFFLVFLSEVEISSSKSTSLVTEETSFCRLDKVFLNFPIYEPIFFNAIGNSLGPKTKIAIITTDKISNHPI